MTQCEGCGSTLVSSPICEMEARQVYDLPSQSLEITEHQIEQRYCPSCGLLNRAIFPPDVRAPVQYGPRLKAMMVYLTEGQFLSSKRAQQLLHEVYGCELSEGTFYHNRHDCYERLAPIEAAIKTGLTHSSVTHFDETGLRVESKSQWLHLACNETLTYYQVHSKRGRRAMDATGILPEFEGISVHDGWQSYRQYDCHHALCNAHHLRELQAVVEQDKQPWAQKMIVLLQQINRQVKHAKKRGEEGLLPREQGQFLGRYRTLIVSGLRMNRPLPTDPNAPKRKRRPKQSKPKNLLDRLKTHESQVLAFMTDSRVPFDNNQAERDLRMMKLKQKVLGSFRSGEGSQQFCRIRGYLSTLRKQGIGVLDALTQLFKDNPIYPEIQAE